MDKAGNYEELRKVLQRFNSPQLIAIEGFCSSGKSTLADKLAKGVPAEVIHTDEYCTPRENPPPYTKGLDVSRLRQALQRRDFTRHCIIEGICLRDILDLCDVSAGVYVYVKRVGVNGLWHDQFHLEEYEKGESVSSEKLEPHASDLAYHSKARPHERADLEFVRVERE